MCQPTQKAEIKPRIKRGPKWDQNGDSAGKTKVYANFSSNCNPAESPSAREIKNNSQKTIPRVWSFQAFT